MCFNWFTNIRGKVSIFFGMMCWINDKKTSDYAILHFRIVGSLCKSWLTTPRRHRRSNSHRRLLRRRSRNRLRRLRRNFQSSTLQQGRR